MSRLKASMWVAVACVTRVGVAAGFKNTDTQTGSLYARAFVQEGA